MSKQCKLGESAMWPGIWNNFAPFAGLMLKGFEKEVALKRMKERRLCARPKTSCSGSAFEIGHSLKHRRALRKAKVR